MAIKANNLIKKFQYALDHKWGYIWGTHGSKWTASAQKTLMKSKDSRYKSSQEYGAQWIGHYVADCSGLFVWAYNSLGYQLPHACRYIWSDCCSKRGNLKMGLRTDGKRLKPGTAVFTKNRAHMGLYVGHGLVIEANSSCLGVVGCAITHTKWVQWGELRKVDYSAVTGLPRYTKPKAKFYFVLPEHGFELEKNTYVEITGYQDKWAKVEHKGMDGYILKNMLVKTKVK